MLILLDQQVPREMEWLCHGVVTVSGADEGPPRPTQWGRPARAECWGSGATNPEPFPEPKPQWACLADPGRGTCDPDPRGSAAFSKRMGGAAVASCPPRFPPWSTRSGSNPGVVRGLPEVSGPRKGGRKDGPEQKPRS